MSDPLQIIARGPRQKAEAAAEALDADPLLEGATYSILEEDEDNDVWRIDAFPNSDEEADGIERVLSGAGGLKVVREKLADADWLAMALSGLPPVRAGRFFIYGAHDTGLVPHNTVNLRIEAGAAFGTGHHGTTVGCLAAYDKLLKRQRFSRVLDVGCGTGVLAIAAARTGTPVAVGTDIDEASVRIANENARLNRARARFVHASGLGHRLVREHGPYDLVFANILARPLIQLSSDIRASLRPGGVAILSGLLRTQARTVTAAYLAHGYRLMERSHRDAWTTSCLTGPECRNPEVTHPFPELKGSATCRPAKRFSLMSVNDPDTIRTTEVRETIGTAPEPAIVHRTVVRESNTGWWLAAFVAVVAILAVVFLVTRDPNRADNQVQAAIDQARTQATLDAQNNMAAQSAQAQSAALQQNMAQSASAAQLAAQQDAANRTAQQVADSQARAELAARQASLSAQQASQRDAERALERANRAAQATTPIPAPADATTP